MSVYQVEEFYIHIDTKSFSEQLKEEIEQLLIDEGQDYEFQTDCLVIDGFESSECAEGLETIINEMAS